MYTTFSRKTYNAPPGVVCCDRSIFLFTYMSQSPTSQIDALQRSHPPTRRHHHLTPTNSPTPPPHTNSHPRSLTRGFRDTVSDGFDSFSDTVNNVGDTVGPALTPQFSQGSLPVSRENAANLDKLLPGSSGDSTGESGQRPISVSDNPLQGLAERLIEPLIAGCVCVCVCLYACLLCAFGCVHTKVERCLCACQTKTFLLTWLIFVT